MKRILYILCASVACILATACQKEIAQLQGETEFTATIGEITKTAMNGFTVNWVQNDKILINGVEYQTSSTGGSTNAIFTPVSGSAAANSTYEAFYPTSIATVSASYTDTKGSCNLPASYTWDANGSYLPMYALSSSTALTFYNICAVLKIIVPETMSVKTITVTAPESTKLNGAFNIEGAKYKAVASSSSTGTNVLTLSCSEVQAGGTFYIPVPEGTYESLDVTIKDSGNTIVKQGRVSKYSVTSGYLYTMNMMLDYFWIEAVDAGVQISFERQEKAPAAGNVQLECSSDGSTWTTFFDATATATPQTLTNAGDRLYFRAVNTNTSFCSGSEFYNVHKFVIDTTSHKRVKIGGNILYLKNNTGTASLDSYQFSHLFNITTVSDASALLLPDTTAEGCYRGMFDGCKYLTAAPALPAKTMSKHCYYFMFYLCKALTSAPVLPSTELAEGCYQSMFAGDSLLTTAPALPATSLAKDCYQAMFQNSGITASPVLSAGTLTEGCYQNMFDYCKKLETVTMTATDVTATNCLTEWLKDAGTGSKTLYVDSSMTGNEIITANKGDFNIVAYGN